MTVTEFANQPMIWVVKLYEYVRIINDVAIAKTPGAFK